MEDGDEPYLDGIKYHAMPPLKRFRDMEHLSGGEKTMAALALLFAVHSYQPSPFFVLDEVDAALDNANVSKIANYIRDHAGPGMQFIVISLKTGLFQGSEALVGIYRDQGANSSKALTLDVSCSRSSGLAPNKFTNDDVATEVSIRSRLAVLEYRFQICLAHGLRRFVLRLRSMSTNRFLCDSSSSEETIQCTPSLPQASPLSQYKHPEF